MKKLLFTLVAALSIHSTAPAADSPEAATYQIRNAQFHDLLRPRDANNANGTPIVLYPAQPWKCMTWRLQPAADGTFHLKNLFTAKTFCAGANTNAPQKFVTQIPLGAESPVWQFTKLPDGSYEIADAKSGNALTAVKNDSEYEAKVAVAPWQNLAAQKWILEKIDPKDLTM